MDYTLSVVDRGLPATVIGTIPVKRDFDNINSGTTTWTLPTSPARDTLTTSTAGWTYWGRLMGPARIRLSMGL